MSKTLFVLHTLRGDIVNTPGLGQVFLTESEAKAAQRYVKTPTTVVEYEPKGTK